MIPTFGLTSRFFIPSMRLLPGRSGISSVRSSSSCTKPGASPLGEQSMLVPFEVANTRNGDAAMKARPTAVMRSLSLAAMWGNGWA